MIYMRQKCPEEQEDYPNRTIWKDKSMILLDSAGNVYKTKRGYSMNEKNKKIHDNCIDIQIDADKFYVKHLKEGQNGSAPTVEIQSIDVQSLEKTTERSDFQWAKIMDSLGPLHTSKAPTETLIGGFRWGLIKVDH